MGKFIIRSCLRIKEKFHRMFEKFSNFFQIPAINWRSIEGGFEFESKRMLSA